MFLVQLKIQYHSCDTNKIFYWCNSSSYKCPKILYTKNSDKMAYANSADSDQSYQGLHCMLGHSTKYFKEQLHKKKKKKKTQKINGIKCSKFWDICHVHVVNLR